MITRWSRTPGNPGHLAVELLDPDVIRVRPGVRAAVCDGNGRVPDGRRSDPFDPQTGVDAVGGDFDGVLGVVVLVDEPVGVGRSCGVGTGLYVEVTLADLDGVPVSTSTSLKWTTDPRGPSDSRISAGSRPPAAAHPTPSSIPNSVPATSRSKPSDSDRTERGPVRSLTLRRTSLVGSLTRSSGGDGL